MATISRTDSITGTIVEDTIAARIVSSCFERSSFELNPINSAIAIAVQLKTIDGMSASAPAMSWYISKPTWSVSRRGMCEFCGEGALKTTKPLQKH